MTLIGEMKSTVILSMVQYYYDQQQLIGAHGGCRESTWTYKTNISLASFLLLVPLLDHRSMYARQNSDQRAMSTDLSDSMLLHCLPHPEEDYQRLLDLCSSQ